MGRASRLARQQRCVAPRIRPAVVVVAESSLLGARGKGAGAAVLNLPAGRALVSMAKPPPRLAGGRPITASAMVPAEKLVTMVPWVPAPLQPLMDKVHPIMIAPRRPMAWLGVDALDTTTNYGALCGHFSFAILTAAYIETDPLKLR